MVVFFRQRAWIIWWSGRRTAPDESMQVSVRVGAKLGVVDVSRQDQRRAAAPTTTLDRRLVNVVFVAERIAVARLSAEVLLGQNANARNGLVLVHSDCKAAAQHFPRAC